MLYAFTTFWLLVANFTFKVKTASHNISNFKNHKRVYKKESYQS